MSYTSRISAELLDEVFQSSIICILTEDFFIAHANKNFCNLLGYTESELTGKSWETLKHTDQAPSSQKNPHEHNINDSWHYELQLINKNGDKIWFDCTIKPSRTIKPKKYIVSCVEINHLKKKAHQQNLIAILSQLSLNNIPIDDLLEQSLTISCSSLNIKTGIIFKLTNNASNAIVCSAYNSKSCIPDHTHIAVSKNDIISHTINSHKPIHVNSLANENRFIIPETILQEDAKSAIFLLIGSIDSPFGILSLLYDTHHTNTR